MQTKSLFIIINVLILPISIVITSFGLIQIVDSDYLLKDINHGFVFSVCWISIGIMLLWQWTSWFISHLLSFSSFFKTEQLIFNAGFILIASCFVISGIQVMNNNPLYLNVCECPENYFGIDCTPCPGLETNALCSGHGTCDDTVFGQGTCGCEQGYVGNECEICALHYTKDNNGNCVCERVWKGDKCQETVIGYDTSQYPYVFCKEGWSTTEITDSPSSVYWEHPKHWPICGTCSPFFAGHADIDCKRCYGWNGTYPITESNVCNGHGECWDNKKYKENVWDKGLKNECTATSSICEKDSDCEDSLNCGGRCRSIYRWPNGPTKTWNDVYNGKLCHKNSDCNFEPNAYLGQVLPAGWDTEGECTERTCCKERKYGNASCYNCRGNDTYVDGKMVRGSLVMGRMPPACEECPGWDNDIDVNGQTICNGKGTCLPLVDRFNEYTQMGCKCQTEGDSVWKGEYCQCLATSIYSDDCQQCVQGFYLPANVTESLEKKEARPAMTSCRPCPGAELGTGIAACSWKKGLGSCIYTDAVVYGDHFTNRLQNVGKCSCTAQLLDVPVIAAKGERCDEAPPNFYKVPFESDWAMMSCPRTLPLDPDVCREIGASDYVWNYIGSDGTSREACTQSCGGKPLKVSICMDEFTSNITYINKTFDDNWVGIDINKKGQCFCKKGFYKATNGLCVKSKN
jgi:hypothetical protein